MIEPFGAYILVHAATPLDVCEERDRKGMYAKARQGIIKESTGLRPLRGAHRCDITIDTSDVSPGEAAQEIVLHLEKLGFIGA